MSSIFGLLILASTAYAVAVENGGDRIIQLASPGPSLSQLVVPSENSNNLTLPFHEMNPALHADHHDYSFVCNGNQYGYIPDYDIQDCMEALGIIRSSRNRIRFAERYTLERTEDVFPLPWRWMGSTLLCISLRINQN